MPVEELSISLPPKMARFIRAKVRSGQYANPGEAVLDAVRLMQDAEKAELRASVMRGVAEVERGECLELDEQGLKGFFRDVNARGRERFKASQKQRK